MNHRSRLKARKMLKLVKRMTKGTHALSPRQVLNRAGVAPITTPISSESREVTLVR